MVLRFLTGLLCAGTGIASVLWGGKRNKGYAHFVQWAGLLVFTVGLMYAYMEIAHLAHPLHAAMRACPPCY